jgi:glycosyltransferase involved in cell wall biosynthesis
LGCFSEVFLFSPLETQERAAHGMYVVPTPTIEHLRRHIVQFNISAVRAYGGYWPATFAVGGRVKGVPVVVSVHDTNPTLLHVSALQSADQIWPVSPAVRAALVRHAQISSSKLRMFSNRVDLSVFRPQPIAQSDLVAASQKDNNEQQYTAYKKSAAVEDAAARVTALAKRFPGKFRVLFVGRRQRQKNWDTVMRCLATLGPNYVGIFVGRAGPKEPMLALAAELGISHRVHIIASVPNEELPVFFWMADVFCVPSRWEGFGIVFVEALACAGAVVVTSDIAPMNQFVEHNVNGLLVGDFESGDAVAREVRRAATDVELRRKVRANARASVARRFGKEYVDAWEVRLYRGVLP